MAASASHRASASPPAPTSASPTRPRAGAAGSTSWRPPPPTTTPRSAGSPRPSPAWCWPPRCPDEVADGRRGVVPAAGAGRRRWRCARRPPPRTCRSPASRASRTPSSTWSARRTCSTRYGAAGRRCGPTRAVAYRARQGIDPRRGPPRRRRAADGRRRGRRRAVHRRPGHRARRRRTVIDASPGLGEAVVSGAVNPDHFVVDTATGAVVERRPGDKRLAIRLRPGGGTTRVEAPPSPDRSCLTDDQLRDARRPGRPGRAAPRLAAGHRVGHRRRRHACGSPVPTDHDAVPPARRRAAAGSRHDGSTSASASRRASTSPITPMGLASFRLLGSSVAPCSARPSPTAAPGRRCTPTPGQRLFVDVTGVLRSRVGRSLMPRVLDPWRPGRRSILRGLLGEPDLSLTQRSWRPFARRVLRVSRSRTACPRRCCRRSSALPRPTGGSGGSRTTCGAWCPRDGRLARPARRRRAPPARPGRAAPRRGGRAARCRGSCRPPPPVSPCSPSRCGCCGPTPPAPRWRRVLRGLPHNVTTEMDLDAVAAGTTHQGRRRGRAVAAATSPPTGWPVRFAAGTLPRTLQDGLTGFLAAYGHRVRRRDRPGRAALGRRPDATSSASWRTTCAWTTRRWRRTPSSPAAPREAEAMVAALAGRARRRRPSPRAGRPVRARAGPAAGRDARAAQGLPRPGAGGRARRDRRSGCAPGRGPDGWTPPTTSSSWTSPRRTAGSTAPTCAPLVAAPAGALRPGAASPPGAPRAALGRHRTRGRSTGPGRRRRAAAARAPRPPRAPSPAWPGWSSTRSAPVSTRARSSWLRRPTRGGRRCSSPRAAW